MAEVMDQAEFQTLVLERLDQNSEFQAQNSEFQDRVLDRFDQMEKEQQTILPRLNNVEQEQRETNIRLEAFQKGSEGVVHLWRKIPRSRYCCF